MRRFLPTLLGVVSLLVGLAAAPSALATTTTLNFDGIANGHPLTTQYQSLGITSSGGTVLLAAISPWDDPYGSNLVYAANGLMTFQLNSTITGAVQTVSVYLSGNAGTGIYAYDVSGNLLGQALLSAAATNQLLSVTSTGNPISSVAIHDGGSTFAIDTFTFASDVPFTKFGATLYVAPKLSAFAAIETFTQSTTSAGISPPTQAVTLVFGGLTTNLPTGSFVADTQPRATSYVFRGTVNGVSLYVSISPTHTPHTYQLFVIAGYAFPSATAPVSVSLTIGNNFGTQSVKPIAVRQPPASP